MLSTSSLLETAGEPDEPPDVALRYRRRFATFSTSSCNSGNALAVCARCTRRSQAPTDPGSEKSARAPHAGIQDFPKRMAKCALQSGRRLELTFGLFFLAHLALTALRANSFRCSAVSQSVPCRPLIHRVDLAPRAISQLGS